MKQINLKLEMHSSYMNQSHTSIYYAIYVALSVLSTKQGIVTITAITHTAFV
jgi:hypothetical protein